MSVPTERRDRAKLAKRIIGFSNSRDGGYLLIGVGDKTRAALGLTQQELETWDGARVANAISSHAAPEPELQVSRGKLDDGKELVAIHIVGFADQPLVCIRSAEDEKGGPIIRAGALYVRADTTETKEIADTLWFLMAPDNYSRLVHQRGWGERKYERSLTAMIERIFAC